MSDLPVVLQLVTEAIWSLSASRERIWWGMLHPSSPRGAGRGELPTWDRAWGLHPGRSQAAVHRRPSRAPGDAPSSLGLQHRAHTALRGSLTPRPGKGSQGLLTAHALLLHPLPYI